MINISNVEISSNTQISQDIIDGLKILWQTPVGTVVLDRDFGVNMSFIDMPIPKAKQMYTVEIITKTKKYEPRISIKKITFVEDPMNGKLNPRIEIEE